MKYVALYQSGELLNRVRETYRRLQACDICPHECGVDRTKGKLGICGAGLLPKIASVNVHAGEEPPISGTKGSGTIFLTGCTLACSFCQNFPISQMGNGEELSTLALARKMLHLQRQGVHNINFVTPTHFMPQILAALWLAIPQGFILPIVWNCSGYEKVDALPLLNGIVSIYMPDMKYSDDEAAVRLSSAFGYREINRTAVTEMVRQVGHLQLDDEGLAIKGLIVRHLVLPHRLAGTREILLWIATELGHETYISLMKQYFPAHRATETQDMGRKVTDDEYDEALQWLEEFDLENGWVQN